MDPIYCYYITVSVSTKLPLIGYACIDTISCNLRYTEFDDNLSLRGFQSTLTAPYSSLYYYINKNAELIIGERLSRILEMKANVKRVTGKISTNTKEIRSDLERLVPNLLIYNYNKEEEKSNVGMFALGMGIGMNGCQVDKQQQQQQQQQPP